MKHLLLLALLASCAHDPAPAPAPLPCMSTQELQDRTEKVKELTQLMNADTELLTDVTRDAHHIGQKFARLSRAFETSSEHSLAKLQQRRAELEAESKANEEEGARIQARLETLKTKLKQELQVLEQDRPVCVPAPKKS